jgi:hypothetical protein
MEAQELRYDRSGSQGIPNKEQQKTTSSQACGACMKSCDYMEERILQAAYT